MAFITEALNKMMEEYLVEGIKEVKKNFPDIDEDTFMKIIRFDPTFKEGVDSVGTYGKWLLNLYRKTHKLPSDNTKEVLFDFDKKKKWLEPAQRDINRYKSVEDVKKTTDEIKVPEKSNARKNKDIRKAARKSEIGKDIEFIGNFDGYSVYSPKTYEATCKLGQGSTWCTASNSDDYYYKNYTEKGPLYVIIDDKNPQNKWQLHSESDSFMDKNDMTVGFNQLLEWHKEAPALFEFIEKKLPETDDSLKKAKFIIELPQEVKDLIYTPQTFNIDLRDIKENKLTEGDFSFPRNQFFYYWFCNEFFHEKEEELNEAIRTWAQELNYPHYEIDRLLHYFYDSHEGYMEGIENRYNVKINNYEDLETLYSENKDFENIFDYAFEYSLTETLEKVCTSSTYEYLDDRINKNFDGMNPSIVSDLANTGTIEIKGSLKLIFPLFGGMARSNFADYEDVFEFAYKYALNDTKNLKIALNDIKSFLRGDLFTIIAYYLDEIEDPYEMVLEKDEFDLYSVVEEMELN